MSSGGTTTSGTADNSAIDTSTTPTGAINGDDTTSSSLKSLLDEMTSMQNYEAAMSANITSMADYQTSLAQQLANLSNYAQNNTSSNNALLDSISALNNTMQTTQKDNKKNMSNYSFDDQVATAQEIKDLGSQYVNLQKLIEFNGVATSDQQNMLDTLHNQANILGIQNGFGNGGADGSGRIIPDAVKQAAGM